MLTLCNNSARATLLFCYVTKISQKFFLLLKISGTNYIFSKNINVSETFSDSLRLKPYKYE